MAHEEGVKSVSLPASGDLSANQYQLVAIDGNGQVALAGDGAHVDGVLYNTPDAAGKAAEVAIEGVVKVKVGASITQGGRAASDASGQAVDPGSGDAEFGTFIDNGGASGEIVSVLLG